MHRFFVDPALLTGAIPSDKFVTLPKDLAHQVRDVLRLQVGEQVLLLDNSGDEVLAEIASLNKLGVSARLLERRKGERESPVRLVLCQGLLKSARFEWVLEKGTELGVSTFSPILCRRSMAGLEDAGAAKVQRWQRIIQEAAEQCGRARLPQLLPIRPLMHALNDIPPGALALMPWEEEHELSLRDALKSFRRGEPLWSPAPSSNSSIVSNNQNAPLAQTLTVVLFIGPEGGLMADEVRLAQRHSAVAISLGERILRAETAALAAIANVMYELGG
jgi:16S rRNA (uracil1498-N3)-methyltransferase